jgi:GMP synthase (glutamine-hydrolysing)
MQILIIDNNIMKESWGSKELAQFAAKTAGATVHVRRAPQSDLPNDLSRFDRVVISGSMTAATDQHPWVHELDEKIRRYAGLGKPILGVCYGHQTLARCLGGVDYVSKKTSAEFGWTRIEQTAPSDLLKDLPKIFY